MKKTPEIKILTPEESDSLLIRAASGTLTAEDVAIIRDAFHTLTYIIGLLRQKNTQVKALLRRLFGIKSEKSKKVRRKLKSKPSSEQADSPPASDPRDRSDQEEEPESMGHEQPEEPKGHGRLGADAFTGAQVQEISHQSLKPKDFCPQCQTGKVYEMSDPGTLIVFSGQPPVMANITRLQKLRCNLCGEIFTAGAAEDSEETAESGAPENIADKEKNIVDKETKGGRDYDPTATSIMAILRYGSGMPLNRLSTLQKNLGIPLAASTLWDKIKQTAALILPVFEALLQLAAQGRIIHHDDTGIKILSVIKQIDAEKESQKEKGKGKNTIRTGIFTTSIVAYWCNQKIALFFSGRRHAGENLGDLLEKRELGRSPPIQMSDAKSGNIPDDIDTIVSYCNTHARRKFVEVADDFPDECLYVIVDVFKEIYGVDALAKKENLSENERLKRHQEKSEPIMAAFHDWLNQQFEEERVEPNSSLGKAISYVLKHWEPLTLFLKVPGVPLDNNVAERALKMAILSRRNSLFYKTEQGARTGDLFMSLIHTCQLSGVNPFHYLTHLQIHAETIRQDPHNWLPWNYQETMGLLDQH